MEAERATTAAPSSKPGHGENIAWWEYTTNTASSGAFVVVSPDNVQYHARDADNGARLDYTINFTETGTHYVMFRYWAPNTSTNSVRLAFNGTVIDSSWNLTSGLSAWNWERSDVTLEVTTPGTHTFTIFHREDGLYLDKVVLSTDGSYLPTGYGPDATETTDSPDVLSFYERRGYTVDYRTGEGFAVLEAEEYTNRFSGTRTYACRKWESVTDASASGGFYMTTAEQGQRSDSTNLWQAPVMDYVIRTNLADTFYIHVRHRSTVGNNSIWLAVDYALVAEWHIRKETGDWVWQSGMMGYVTPSGGDYLLSIIMREDATPIDKIIITTDKNYDPTNIGKGYHTTLQEPPGMYFTQGSDLNGLVELPLEYPSRNIAGNGSYQDLRFKKVADGTATNDNYIVVPNRGTTAGENIVLGDGLAVGGPIMEYDIYFQQTGRHYLSMRHRSPSHEDNSYSVYLNDTAGYQAHLNQVTTEWRYYDDMPTINIPHVGWHKLTVAMREDGTPLDHLILSTSPTFSAQAMPVELLDFAGEAHATGNLLYWTTAHEELTATHFVERSADGSSAWEVIGQVAAAGHSNELLDYELLDRQPLPTAYYRLRTVDQDASESLSAMVRLQREATRATASTLEVYPNPSRGQTTIQFTQPLEEDAVLRVHSLTGQLMASRHVTATAGSHRIPFDTSRLPTGTYTLSAEVAGSVLLQRLVVQ